MFFITASLLGGWILSLFGFDGAVEVGMKEVFNVEISQTGYYFLFGLIGALRSISANFGSSLNIKLLRNQNQDKTELIKHWSKK